MKRWIFVAAMIVSMVLTGCSSGSAKGTITGSLMAVGGPVGNAAQPLPGTVVLMNSSGRSTTMTVSDDGIFEVHVAAGSYSLSGSSPLFGDGRYDCLADGPVQVQVSTPVMVEVDCAMK
jgi:hypothetical protein